MLAVLLLIGNRHAFLLASRMCGAWGGGRFLITLQPIDERRGNNLIRQQCFYLKADARFWP